MCAPNLNGDFSGFCRHQTAGEFSVLPEGGEGLGHRKPIPAGALSPMIFAHTGALAFMTFRVPAGRGTNFLLTIRLDNIEFAMPREDTDHEIVAPSLG